MVADEFLYLAKKIRGIDLYGLGGATLATREICIQLASGFLQELGQSLYGLRGT